MPWPSTAFPTNCTSTSMAATVLAWELRPPIRRKCIPGRTHWPAGSRKSDSPSEDPVENRGMPPVEPAIHPKLLLLVQIHVRPLPSVFLLQPAQRVELEDFLTQVVEVVLGVADIVAHRFP